MKKVLPSMQSAVNVPIETIKLSQLIIGDRFRRDLGNLEIMENSIRVDGLMNPITVQKKDGEYHLIAGGRRTLAILHGCKKDKINPDDVKIKVRVYENISEEEKVVLELAENLYRKNLTYNEDLAIKEKVHAFFTERYGLAQQGAHVGGHTLKDTASLLGMPASSVGNLQKELELAKLMKSTPEIDWSQFKNKSQALKTVNQVKKMVAARDAAKKVTSVSKESRFKTLVDSYHISDMMEGMAELQSRSFDFIELDTDYGIDLADRRKQRGGTPFTYTQIDSENYPKVKIKVLSECARLLKDNSWIVNWIAFQYLEREIKWMRDLGFKMVDIPGMWVKTNSSGETASPKYNLGPKCEIFIYGRKGNAELQKQGRSNVFDYPMIKSSVERYHDCPKPVELYKDVLETFAKPGDSVLVPCAGSGSSMIASALLNMNPLGFDLSQDHKNGYILLLNKYGISA